MGKDLDEDFSKKKSKWPISTRKDGSALIIIREEAKKNCNEILLHTYLSVVLWKKKKAPK